MMVPRTPVTAFIEINLGLKLLIKLTSEKTLMMVPWTPIMGGGRCTYPGPQVYSSKLVWNNSASSVVSGAVGGAVSTLRTS